MGTVKTTTSEIGNTWKTIPWKRYHRIVFRLQRRIYEAEKAENHEKARYLQKLLLKSFAARMLAVRQVTQLNQGKKTAGVDGKVSLTNKERMGLANQLRHAKKWRHQELRSIEIPKKNGKMRELKIPTIADSAWQCLCKLAIEPAHEVHFHERSYGFRPGRSAHDAQKVLFLNLKSDRKGYEKRILELDIEKCFDRISHASIMEKLIAPQAIKQRLYQCLKAGVNAAFPNQGTPQGGVISPLLANIALEGIEKIHSSIRYADDMVIILKPNDDADVILGKIKTFLAERMMKVSEAKTKLVSTLDGFDFLGWKFYVQRNNGKFRSEPSKANYETFHKKIKDVILNPSISFEERANKIAPIVRGWRNYHKYTTLDGSRFSLWRLNQAAFKTFLKGKNTNKYKAEELVKKAFPTIGWNENRFINVKGNASPFDGKIVYWAKRNSEKYDGSTVKTLKHQNYACGKCNLKFWDDEKIHLHPIDGNHENLKTKNLIAVHHSCH